MQVTARTDYAVRAMVQLVDGPASRATIAAEQGIPAKFLEVILLRLRQGGLLAL